MDEPQRNLLDGQMQGPAIELSTEWLIVGHVDEYYLLVPAPVDPERPWRLVFASPELALNSLDQAVAEGNGQATVFTGLQTPQSGFGGQVSFIDVEQTVNELVQDQELREYNLSVQARIDSIRQKLLEETGFPEEAVVEVPVLYEVIEVFDGVDFSASKNPGIQNLITLNNDLFVPDPVGPLVDGQDVWQTMTSSVLEPLGLNVHFVDVWYSYHVLIGEAHCGSEVDRVPFAQPWWEVEDRQ